VGKPDMADEIVTISAANILATGREKKYTLTMYRVYFFHDTIFFYRVFGFGFVFISFLFFITHK
jgi:hypothetical protein